MNIRFIFKEIFDKKAKRVTMLQLRKMTDRQLLDCGFSPVLLKEGVKAWPWRELEDNRAASPLGQLSVVAPRVAKLPQIAEATEVPQKAAA